MKIKISADSTCDLSPELIEQFQIGIIPLHICIGDSSYRDMLEIDPVTLFKHVDAGESYHTAGVNVQEYLDAFGDYLKEYDAVVHFTICSDMSSCYQNACIAAQELGNVYVVDSRNLSTGIGHLVLDAAELAAQGMAAEDIKRELDARKEKLDVSFVLATLEYLQKGGRCSAVVALGANLLKLRPCVQVRDGAMRVGKKFRGNMDKCYLDYIRDALSQPETIDTRRIFITDSGLTAQQRKMLEDEVRNVLPFREIYHTEAGCTVSGHCGPHCMGVLFYRK